MTSTETIAPATRKRTTGHDQLTGKERLKMAPTNVSVVLEQPSQTMPPGRRAEEWRKADAIGAYLVCMAGLFAACAAVVDLKVALWGFGLLHFGCALSVLVLWWHEHQRETKATAQPPLAVEEEQETGAILAKHVVSVHR